jgi:hypothetical protein
MSRWATGWSRGSKPNKMFSDFLNEGPVDPVRTGNPTGSGALSPGERAKQLGLQSNGKGGYIDPKTGQVVARTINNELVFYSAGPGGGAVSDGSGGAAMARPSSSWQDPITGLMVTPPSQAETPNEIAAIPDPVPSQAPAGYNQFIQQRKLELYSDDAQAREQQNIEAQMGMQPPTPDQAPMGGTSMPEPPMPMAQENYLGPDLVKRSGGMGPPTFSELRDKAKAVRKMQQGGYVDGGDAETPILDRMKSGFDQNAQSGRIPERSQLTPEQEDEPFEPDGLEDLIQKVRQVMDKVADEGGNLAKDGDDLGDELRDAADSGNLADVVKTVGQIRQRDFEGSVPQEEGSEDAEYIVTSPGGLGSDRGRYVEQGLTDYVLPSLYPGRQFHNDGGSRVKTDVRSTDDNGNDIDRYTVKATVGNDGLEANNAGFRRFFETNNLDPESGPGLGFSRLFGPPLDYADNAGFGDGLGQWDDTRDGLHRDGQEATRQMPIQLLYPGVDFSREELNANSMLYSRLLEMHPKEAKEMIEWLMDNRRDIVRRIASQRDNDFGPGGQPDPNARANIDYDPNPVNRAAWYHLSKDSRGSGRLDGRLDIHDISPEVLDELLPNARWTVGNSISGGMRLLLPHQGKDLTFMTLTRKANKGGGGRYGNGFHSPRFGYQHNSFDAFPHVSSTPVSMTMGAKQEVPILKPNGQPRMDRQGNIKTQVRDGKIIPGSVKIGETTWGEGYQPQ